MKNLKKLNRKELETINGGNWLDDVIGIIKVVEELEPLLCPVSCLVNGVLQTKLLPCNSTC